MRLPFLLWFVSAVDFMRSAAVIIDPAALNSTALWPLRPMGHVVAGVLGCVAAFAAFLWLYFRPPGWGVLALFPQFAVLCLGAYSALSAVALGQYADGTTMAPAHIFSDQIVWVLLPLFYGAAAAVEFARSGVPGAT